MAGGFSLGIGLRFHNPAPQQAAVVLPFRQAAADKLGSHHFCRAAEEAEGQSWEVLSRGGNGDNRALSMESTSFVWIGRSETKWF